MPDRAARDLERQREATLDLEKKRLALDQERIELEKRKLALEDRKLDLEERKLALEVRKIASNLHVEDFKARWQELLNF